LIVGLIVSRIIGANPDDRTTKKEPVAHTVTGRHTGRIE
jgi:hypothetical protein